MSIFSFARFPALYLSAFITNSFGLALCSNVEDSDGFIKGTITWFSLCIFAFIALAVFDYKEVINRSVDTTPNVFTIIAIILAFINYVAIFALFFNKKYKLDEAQKVNSSVTAVTGVFFTMFVLSLFFEVYAYFSS